MVLKQSDLTFKTYRYVCDEKEGIEKLNISDENILEVYTADEEKIAIVGTPASNIVLKNCSNKPIGPFKIRLIVQCRQYDELSQKGIKKEYAYEAPDEYILEGHESQIIHMQEKDLEGKGEIRGSGWTKRIKVILVDKEEQVVFEQPYWD